MELFAVEEDITQWEAALPLLCGPERLSVLLPLAWHLRERNSERAEALATEALALLLPDQHAERARLQLVRAEVLWLRAALDAAESEADAALDLLRAAGDQAGCADAHWLQSWIALDRGDHARRDRELALAIEAATLAQDRVRQQLLQAATARWAILRDPANAASWAARLGRQAEGGAAAWLHDFLGNAASQANDFPLATRHFIRSYQCALDTGQKRLAVIAATSIGKDFSNLNDHQTSLKWMQRALDLARPADWPRCLGVALMHTANTMRRLERIDAAEALLREALATLAPLSEARSYALALQYLGDLSLDQHDYGGALDAFTRLAARAEALQQAEFRCAARRGQAHALSAMGQVEAALAAAHDALRLADEQAQGHQRIAALSVLASIHGLHRLPAPAGMQEPSAALHYLKQALAAASAIEGHTLPGDLLDAVAREYAAACDYRRAYEAAQAAADARTRTHSQKATDLALVMHIHHQTEQATHHVQLAEAQTQASMTQARLSAIDGQLKDAQTQLVAQEKLAALGALMAGIAHELNTPIGNSLLIASTLQQKTAEVGVQLCGAGLRRSELAAYLDDAQKASELVLRGLNSAADLVNSFKQVAVDRTTEQRRIFNLRQVTHEVIATMHNRVRHAGHAIAHEVPEMIMMDSYPGPYGQVLSNLINNALLHAFDGRAQGRIRLDASTPVEGRVLLSFCDDGCGIAEEHRERIFDPFYSTKLGQGGSGLGLAICRDIIENLLGGAICMATGPQGTVFTLDLPLTAPPHPEQSIYRM